MYIKVRVTPHAKKETFKKKSEDHFEISVREKAKQNMANRKVVEVVARELRVPKEKIKIISGHHSPSKILSVR